MDTFGEKIYYPYVLDFKPRFLLGWMLYRLFKRTELNESAKEKLKQMHKEGTIVFALKYRSKLDYLLNHYHFKLKRLPHPKIAFDTNISLLLPLTDFSRVAFSHLSYLYRHHRFPSPYETGFYRKAVQEGVTCLIFLIDPKRFVRRFVHEEKDHLQFLLETQKDMERPIFLVPQLVLFEEGPEKDTTNLKDIFFGYKDYAGLIRKSVLFFRHHRRAYVDFGPPLNLQDYLRGQPAERPLNETALEIKDVLIESIDQQKRVILGPTMKSRDQVKEIVLMDKKVSEKIEAVAGSEGKELWELKKRAGEYFDEIAADFNITYVRLFDMMLKWLWKRIFEGIDVEASTLATVREWARRGPIIYVPSHKSHIDYLILNHVLHANHMHIPRIAAGSNLTFWPAGHIFRKSGAFFIRRSFNQPRLYVEVFSRYIKALLQEGHPIEFFIEGGRSRNGKLVLPKTGFVSILLHAHKEGYCKDLVFVPASIVYDRILEEQSYIKELRGGSKERESLKHVIGARRILKRKYGKVYLRFGQPLSLNDYLAHSGKSMAETTRRFSFEIAKAINEVTLVTPLSLVATAILAYHRRGFLYSELLGTVEMLLGALKDTDAPLAASLNDLPRAVQETLSLLIGWKIVEDLEEVDSEEEAFYFVEDEKKLELEYYKNSIIHFFLPNAFVATSLLTGREEIKSMDALVSDCDFMKNLLKHEFFLNGSDVLRQTILPVLDSFLQASLIMQAGGEGGFKISKLGFEKLPVWSGIIKTFLESYWIVARSLCNRKNAELKEEAVLKKMSYLGRRFHKLGVVEHIESLSRLNFQNAVAFFQKDVLNRKELERNTELAFEKLYRITQRIYELAHQRL
ncbi:MAG: 1-acyl-sn-glycerol-3-phosphate acyltransferase [Deltaproteobacteria bacterium]|nr:1-acyl-sn-glycerol-3-phosphate acyltransferase [Deltaproteobacteria bacterium]